MGRVLESTAKRLFAVSGNQCAFPRCTTPLVDASSGKVTGRICHIKARSPKGPRYDASQSDDERNDFANLFILCGVHHDVIDADEEAYTVDRLRRMKSAHEAACAARQYELSDELAHTLVSLSVSSEATVSASHQSGGQIAYSIVNNYASGGGDDRSAPANSEHDVRIFREADALFSEDIASEFFADLLDGHEYYGRQSAALHYFVQFLRKISNEFLDGELETLSDELVDALDALHGFIALRFFRWPELQNRENARYCLWPWGNIDRAGHGDPESEKRYDGYLRELRTYVGTASTAMVAYRRAVKKRLFL